MIDNLPPTLTRVDPATKRSAEYIRADVVQAQLDAANARIAELESLCRTMQNLSDVHGLLHGNALARIAELEAEYKLHRESSLADFLKQSDEHKAEIERLKSRVAFDCRQLLAERDKRIAELEALALTLVDELEGSEKTVIREYSGDIDGDTEKMRANMEKYRQQIKPQS